MTHNPEILPPEQIALAMNQVMQSRRTVKISGDMDDLPNIPDSFYRKVQESMKIAGWAPFHFCAHHDYRQGEMSSPVPWRFYSLDQNNCVRLAKAIIAHPDLGLDEQSGVVKMLAACGSLVMVTWLPEPEDSTRASGPARHIMMDEEHLAAAAAATQNLLLAAKARKIDTYWSSGGMLRDWECLEMCGIPVQEKLLGAIFMSPEKHNRVGVHTGKLRDQRGASDQWMTSVII